MQERKDGSTNAEGGTLGSPSTDVQRRPRPSKGFGIQEEEEEEEEKDEKLDLLDRAIERIKCVRIYQVSYDQNVIVLSLLHLLIFCCTLLSSGPVASTG